MRLKALRCLGREEGEARDGARGLTPTCCVSALSEGITVLRSTFVMGKALEKESTDLQRTSEALLPKLHDVNKTPHERTENTVLFLLIQHFFNNLPSRSFP